MSYRLILLGITLGVIYWFLESAIHVFIFPSGHFGEQIVHPDPHELWMRVFVVCILIAFSISAQLIINKLTQREKQILREKRFNDALLNSMSEGIAVIDLEGTLTAVNPALASMTGYSKEELIGSKPPFYGWDQDRAEHILERFKSVPAGDSQPREVKMQRKNGVRFSATVIPFPILDEHRNTIAFAALAKDITGQKQAEKALHESEAKLRQAQKMEAIGRLAGGVAHDFNNLLTAIIGYSDLMLMESDSSCINTECIIEIKAAAARATSLTQQLLAFSRKQMLQPKTINLNALISNLKKLLARLISEHIELTMELDSELGAVKADPGQMEQAIMNLAINARDAMPMGGKLTLETKNIYLDESYKHTHPEVIPGRYVMLAVSDTGHGIDKNTKERIFEPFFTTKERGKGTGLGLSTVYGIVKQSGGYIWVYSELNHGTTFKMYLPQIEENEKYQEYAQQVKAAPKGGTETILFVEDEETLRNMAGKILKKHGYTVIQAGNGRAALEMMAEPGNSKIDLLVTDVIMPEMNGKALSKKLIDKYPHLKVLFISGYTDNVIVHHGVIDEEVEFLQKPFSLQSLVQKVRDVLERKCRTDSV